MSVLVVVTVLEGKQFPSKGKSQLQVTCKFAGELLNSDPVPHTSAPYFNTELAWELTRKTLHQHRLQRTPLKLTLQSKSGSTIEEVGHIMLDLRSIAAEGAEYKWYPLARSKYKTHKPQVRLLLTTENADEDEKPTQDVPKKLFVSLDEASGTYQVGEPVDTNPTYSLSLTVIAAANLLSLIDSSKPAAFCFRFNLLDNLVTNSAFVNAASPDFPMERVSVKLCGSLQNLYKYLASVQDVSLQLCQGSMVVGVVSLPLTKLLTSTEDEDAVNSLHSCLQLSRPNGEGVLSEARPTVEVHFTLRENGRSDTVPAKPLPQIADISADTDDMLIASPTDKLLTDVRRVPISSPSPASTPPPATVPRLRVFSAEEGCTGWVCSIRFSHATINRSGKRYIRYVYPFFGTTSPHATSVIKFIAGSTTTLPPSGCEYSFAADRGGVHSQFTKVPLVLQFWSKAPDSENLEGTAVLSLAPMLQAGLQEISGKIISKSDDKVIGEVVMCGWLEEKGPAPKHVRTEPNSDRQRATSDEGVPEREQAPYKAALELELWKELEQEKFVKDLELKAENRMKQITLEWKKKETERDDETRKQISEYNKLKEKMKLALRDLEIRENHILEQERKLLLSQEDLVRERARLTSDVREASRRVEEEFTHKLSLQRQKLAGLEKQNKELIAQVEEAEARLEKRNGELAAARDAQLTAPAARVQTQLEILKMEKEEMERKIVSLEKAKIHYKENWTKALKELINVRERSQQDTKRRLLQEQSLMEHARLRYLSLEDRKLNDKEKLGEDVENLKGELNKMREQLVPNREEKFVSNGEAHTIDRLVQERNSLLKTGVYNEKDALIQELDSKINLLRNT